VFGASGLLRDRLRGGERADLFASANMEHPRSLADEGRAEGLRVFARNALCALAAPGLGLDVQNLVRRLLDPAVRVGISTPKADPSGDYAFEMFDRIESTGAAPAGSAAALKAKALQLTGGPASPPPPADRNVYGALVAEGQADMFITYCTNATIARKEQPRLQVVAVPEAINVAASYGLVALKPATPQALRFAEHLSGTAGQQRLAAYGFSPP
jgi:ABC-type molybdate transport system substrate-binding protein